MSITSTQSTLLQPMNAAGGMGQSLSAPIGGSDFQKLLQNKSKQFIPQTKAEKQAHEAAAGLVSEALILPILKQVRQSPFNKDGPFSPGNGEKTFGPEFDMQLADRIAHSPRMGITNALAKKLIKRGADVKAKGNAPATRKLDLHG